MIFRFVSIFLCCVVLGRATFVAGMAPPLPPKPLGTYLTGNPSSPTIAVDCYIDLVCPFAGRMFLTLYDEVLPLIQADNRKADGISIKIHHVVQPWHPQSTLVHEAALAVRKVDASAYLGYVRWVCRQFAGDEKKFSDEDTWNKSRAEIYEELLKGFSPTPPTTNPAAPAEAMNLLVPPEGFTGNSGNGVTQDIKWACKHHRAMGVHVTPTVFVNGIEAIQISSGWKTEDWMEFFDTFDLS